MSFRPFAPARAFRPFGAGSPGVFAGTPVDALLLFSSGTPGNIITAANLDSAMIGALPGTWAVQPDPLTHTKYETNTDVRRTPLRCEGVSYDGSENSLGIYFDLDEAIANEYTNDLPYWTPPVGPTITDLSITMLMRFNAIGRNDQDIAMDHIMISAGAFAILQQKITQAQFGVNPASAGTIAAHGQLTGGVSTFGPGFNIEPDVLYSVTLRSKKYDGIGYAEVIVLNGVTGDLVGMSVCRADMGNVTRITVQDYLSFGGGKTSYKMGGVDWTNAAFPLEPMTVPTPSSFEAELVDSDTAHLIWDGRGTGFRVEREVGGVWSALGETDATEYVDDTYVTGMRYRVVATIDTLESAPTAALEPTDSGTLGLYRTPFPGASEGSSNWPDAFGVHDMSGASAQPLYTANVLNGFPVMRFTGAVNLPDGGPDSSTYPRTIIAVLNRTGGTIWCDVLGSNQATSGLEFAFYADPGLIYPIAFNQNVFAIGDGALVGIPDGWHVLAWVITATTLKHYVDGVLTDTYANAQVLTAGRTFVMGGRDVLGANDRHLTGDLAYVRIFDREVLDAEIASRSAALIAKYGL